MFGIRPPSWLPRRPRLNFITLHYLYIVGFAFVGSFMLYPAKNMSYIDALFFASGASTQSGLNTIDINLLKTYQQAVFMFMSWLTNPITINTALVFIRLHWFEKRFQSIVKQSKLFVTERRTMSRRRSESEGVDNAERGVAGRPITLVENSARKTHSNKTDDTLSHGHRELLEFRKSIASGFASFKYHGKSKSDSNHRMALRQSRPGGVFPDGNNDHDCAVEDDEDDVPAPHSPVSPTTRVAGDTLSDISEKDGENTAPSVHITFADAKPRTKRKDSEVYVVPTPYDVENRGSGLAHKVVVDDEDQEGGPKDEDALGSSTGDNSGLMKRAITIDEPTMTRDSTQTGPRQRMKSNVRTPTEQSHLYIQPHPGIRSVLSNTLKLRRDSSTGRRMSKVVDPPYLTYALTIGRNSQFNFGELSEEQREELGGVEYRSLRLLSQILVVYFIFFQLFGILCLLPWINANVKWGKVLDDVHQNKTWWAIFTSSSAFTDLGFTLTPDSMISFNTATWPLLAMSYLIIIGNTGFPFMLRFIIWLLWKICPSDRVTKESLHFLLDHPRRCFTLLFPSGDTWWLFGALVGLNAIDVLLFIILDLHAGAVTDLPVHYRILDAFFQAVSTRTAGFSVVSLADLHPGVQVSYLVMMYISVFPIAISVRKTNVYEERSLGIYASNEESDDAADHSFFGAHLRKQLSFDLWFIFLGLFTICIAEGARIQSKTDYAFTQFSCFFEIISAYGTVGLSLGYPGVNTSFSGQLSTFSKVVIMAMMVRGRHRGLPYELDRAILLPSEALHQKEAEDSALRVPGRSETMDRKSLRPPSQQIVIQEGDPVFNEKEEIGNSDSGDSTGVTSGFQPQTV
ncbi:hypothetical protein DRE_00349 [Drechslerella stenobrocha 248]|uniref:Potassium transport protein n=1 Tax=Drechslerella stenobrocha 248 TaxID=1043628 RepID=W7HTD6_9PEZI|nr:hypothetical protein DRE_00349 [Drechslerella stenobrocha 248]